MTENLANLYVKDEEADVNWDSSFCTLITEAANVACFLADFASLSTRRGGKSAGRRTTSEPESAACCTIVNTLHISRSIRGPSNLHLLLLLLPLPFQRSFVSLQPARALYSVGLQLAKIDRVKVHDGAGHIGFRLCVSGDARYRICFLFFLFFFFTPRLSYLSL